MSPRPQEPAKPVQPEDICEPEWVDWQRLSAAEFSRDVDLAIVADSENLSRLSQALEALAATVTAVPPYEARYLEQGTSVAAGTTCAGSAST
jgi:hypothetical protein